MMQSSSRCPFVKSMQVAHTSGNPCARFAVTMVLVFIFTSGSVCAQNYDTPEDLLYAREALSRNSCDLDCSKKIAAMYSQRFLELTKQSIVATLRSSTDRESDAIILFGVNIPQPELEQMPSVSIFAHQLLHAVSTVPSEYRFTKTEIISRKDVSPHEVYIFVRNSGMAAAPKLEEEESIHFLLEDNRWKIDR